VWLLCLRLFSIFDFCTIITGHDHFPNDQNSPDVVNEFHHPGRLVVLTSGRWFYDVFLLNLFNIFKEGKKLGQFCLALIVADIK